MLLDDLQSSTAGQNWTALLSSNGFYTEQQTRLWRNLSIASASLLLCAVVAPCITAILIVIFSHRKWQIIIVTDIFSGVIAVAAAIMWTIMFATYTIKYASGTGEAVK